MQNVKYSLTSKVLVGLIVMLPEAWDLDVLADGEDSMVKILNGAFVSNFIVSGVSVVLVSTKRWASSVCPSSYLWAVGKEKFTKKA